MARTSFRQVGEAAAVLGVVGSLIFVGLELRNNGRAARAAAYQEIGLATAGSWFMRAEDPRLNDLLYIAMADDPDEWESLEESDRRRVESYVVAIARVYETVFLQVEEQLLPAGALESLGYAGFGDANILRRTWPEPLLNHYF